MDACGDFKTKFDLPTTFERLAIPCSFGKKVIEIACPSQDYFGKHPNIQDGFRVTLHWMKSISVEQEVLLPSLPRF